MSSKNLTVVVGGAYGDEGKGKVTSYLAFSQKVDAVVRAGVGTNAGHTVVHNNKTYRLRTIPSGFIVEKAKMYIGAGVYINQELFFQEIDETGVEGRIFLDRHTGVITQDHIEQENKSKHLMGKIGSTGSGSGAANASRVLRKLKVAKDYEELVPYTSDVSFEVYNILKKGGKVLIEGSQATFLSLYHGTYPYVTSKDVSASACLSDVGLGPTAVDEVVIVFKAFVTRVGEGELKNELTSEEAKRRGWDEYGTVTGRQRRSAPFDFDLAKKAVRINGATAIALTKMDIVFPQLEGEVHSSKLVGEPYEFVRKVEKVTGVPVKYISTGPDSFSVIDLAGNESKDGSNS